MMNGGAQGGDGEAQDANLLTFHEKAD